MRQRPARTLPPVSWCVAALPPFQPQEAPLWRHRSGSTTVETAGPSLQGCPRTCGTPGGGRSLRRRQGPPLRLGRRSPLLPSQVPRPQTEACTPGFTAAPSQPPKGRSNPVSLGGGTDTQSVVHPHSGPSPSHTRKGAQPLLQRARALRTLRTVKPAGHQRTRAV